MAGAVKRDVYGMGLEPHGENKEAAASLCPGRLGCYGLVLQGRVISIRRSGRRELLDLARGCAGDLAPRDCKRRPDG